MMGNNWTTKKFGECVEEILDHRGKTPKKLNMDWGNGDILALSANNVKDGYIDTELEANYASESLYEKWMTTGDLDKGDIVMTMEAPLGNVTQIPDNKRYLLSQRVAAFKPIAEIDKTYFRYYPLSNRFQSLLDRFSTGTTAKGISQKNLTPLEFSYTPFKEQQKIAAIRSSVDEAIEKTEEIIEQTERVKKGLMQELLTKGIGHTEFKDSPVGKVPQGWEIAIFKDVFDRITTKNSIDNQNVLTISGEYGLISQLEYFNKSVSAKSLTNYTYLENGDFAYNKSYSNGYPLGAIKRLDRYETGVVSTLYICFRLKDPNINGFYKYYFDSPYWHRQVYSIAPEGGRSHGLLNVGVKDFFEILIPVPPVEEQMMIERKLSSIDEKVMVE